MNVSVEGSSSGDSHVCVDPTLSFEIPSCLSHKMFNTISISAGRGVCCAQCSVSHVPRNENPRTDIQDEAAGGREVGVERGDGTDGWGRIGVVGVGKI